METISISKLKAHLSAELKKVRKGIRLVVVDHNQPVAVLSPYESEPVFLRVASSQYEYGELTPLTNVDPLEKLGEERKDRW
jgi:prevent-host-death family protein